MVVKHLLPKLTFWCLVRSSRYVMVLLLLVVQSEKVSDENIIRSLELPFRSGPLRFFQSNIFVSYVSHLGFYSLNIL